MAAVAVLLFVLGCVLGSFISVVAHRVPQGDLDRRSTLSLPEL